MTAKSASTIINTDEQATWPGDRPLDVRDYAQGVSNFFECLPVSGIWNSDA
jgi:hypothetical protein